MRRRGRDISSQPDYFLAREGDRRDFRGVTLRAPRHHDSDHRAVIATVYAGTARRLAGYIRRRSRFPVRPQRMATQSHAEQIFEQLKATCEAPPKRERKENVWIQPATWALIDTRAALRKEGKLTQQSSRTHNRRIKAALKEDRRKRAADVAETIELKLAEGEMQEAWRLLKGWYRSAEDRPPKPCHDAMTKQTKDRETLYAKVSPPGASIPINVQPFDIKDDVPEEPEIRAVVKGLRNGRAGGASGMCAEHIKQWLRDMIVEEEDGKEGLGDKWRLFIELIQIVWAEGEIPQQMAWMTVVLLPKGGGDYRGIGLLEPFWKVVEILMDGRMEAINFHDCLHGFLKGRGTGTATIEAKLAQQLAFIEQEALLEGSTFPMWLFHCPEPSN